MFIKMNKGFELLKSRMWYIIHPMNKEPTSYNTQITQTSSKGIIIENSKSSQDNTSTNKMNEDYKPHIF